MQFKLTTPEPENGILKSWASENEAYQIDLYRVIYGYRVRVRVFGEQSYFLDYCAGANPQWIQALLVVVSRCMMWFDEETPHYIISASFPSFERKPMLNDMECWNKLLVLSGIETTDLFELSEMEVLSLTIR